MITVRFFASLRERLGVDSVDVHPEGLETVDDIRKHLVRNGPEWDAALNQGRLMMAVDQAMAREDSPVRDGMEVAFFPPVTGG